MPGRKLMFNRTIVVVLFYLSIVIIGIAGHSNAFTPFSGGTASSPSITVAKGDIISNNGSTEAVLSVGSDDQVLTADSAAPNGVAWKTASGGGGSAPVGSAELGDCKFSLLSTTDFTSIHGAGWVRMEGQSIVGTDLATTYSITSLPDAVSNGAFFRQLGGNSSTLRAFQDDLLESHSHSLSQTATDGLRTSGGSTVFAWGNPSASSTTLNSTTSTSGGSETRPKNIALNFYCKVSN